MPPGVPPPAGCCRDRCSGLGISGGTERPGGGFRAEVGTFRARGAARGCSPPPGSVRSLSRRGPAASPAPRASRSAAGTGGQAGILGGGRGPLTPALTSPRTRSLARTAVPARRSPFPPSRRTRRSRTRPSSTRPPPAASSRCPPGAAPHAGGARGAPGARSGAAPRCGTGGRPSPRRRGAAGARSRPGSSSPPCTPPSPPSSAPGKAGGRGLRGEARLGGRGGGRGPILSPSPPQGGGRDRRRRGAMGGANLRLRRGPPAAERTGGLPPARYGRGAGLGGAGVSAGGVPGHLRCFPGRVRGGRPGAGGGGGGGEGERPEAQRRGAEGPGLRGGECDLIFNF